MSAHMKRNQPMKHAPYLTMALLALFTLAPFLHSETSTEGFAVEWQRRTNAGARGNTRTLPLPPKKPTYTSDFNDEEPLKHTRLTAAFLSTSNAAGAMAGLGFHFSKRAGLDFKVGFTQTTNTSQSASYIATLSPNIFITEYVGVAIGGGYGISTGRVYISSDLLLDFGPFGAIAGFLFSTTPNDPAHFLLGVSTRF